MPLHYISDLTVDSSYFNSVTYSNPTIIPGNFTQHSQVLRKNCLQNTLFKERQKRRDDEDVDGGSYLMALWKTEDNGTFQVETIDRTCWRSQFDRSCDIFARQP